jgi:TRAP transporter TAXI family solute receptor
MGKSKLVAALLASLLVLAACGADGDGTAEDAAGNGNGNGDGDGEDAAGDWPEVLTVATAGQGSSSHVAGTLLAGVWTQETPLRRVVVEPYGAASQWVELMDAGEVHVGIHGSFRATADAYYGEGQFDDPLAVMTLMVGWTSPWGFLTTDESIASVEELAGNRLLVLEANRDHRNVVQGMQDFYDIEGEVDIIPTESVGSAIQFLQEGRADAFLFGVTPGLEEVRSSTGLWGIPVDDDFAEAVTEEYEETITRYTIGAGQTLLEPEEDLPFLGLPQGLSVNEDLDPEVVQELVRVLYEVAGDELRDAHPSFADWTPEIATEVMASPLHQGMVDYLESQGQWDDELQAEQDRLLEAR